MSHLTKNVMISPEEYLAGEPYSDVRHEYVAGHVYAMGGSERGAQSGRLESGWPVEHTFAR